MTSSKFETHKLSPEERAVLDKMKRLCSRGEKSQFAIELKLRETGISEQAQTEIINQLIQDNFLNELRFARAYVHDKTCINLWGPLKIKAGLRAQRISNQIIQQATSEIEDELIVSNIQKLIGSKSLKFDYRNPTFQKMYRKLIGKGYSPNDIANVID